MALGINTNVASINAQNQLSKSQSMNDQALERLSSGLRINSAKDDAAGLAISTRFEAQINGLDQANRNANDGISLAQTAEGGLDEITNNLQRVRELAVQSANATNSASDREALNDEVQQRIEEIDRIASTTAFNGLNVLDGSLDTQDFQVGANAGETISVDLNQGSKADQVGDIATAELDFADASGGATAFSGGASFDIAVGDGEATTISIDEGASAAEIAEAVEGESLQGVNTVSASSEGIETYTAVSGGSSGGTYSFDLALGGDSESIAIDVAAGDTLSGADVADAVNEQGPEGLTASFDSGSGEVTFSADSGENINLSNENLGGSIAGTGLGSPNETYVGNVTVDANDDVTVTNTGGSIAQLNDTAFTADAEQSVATSGALEDVTVSTVGEANDAIKRADAALDSINSIRSELGAVQNRFESTIANLDNNIENLEASNSRIKDADFAAESAKLSQSQVLQQAGISVLSQANQRPQQVLSLLQ